MRLTIDKARCDKCGLCLDACPKLPVKKDYRIFDCSCRERLCLSCCPRGAILETNRVIAIDRKKCSGCGDCLKLCPNKAIVRQMGYYSKCDFCFETGRQKCVNVCPKKAISLEYDEGEKEKIRQIIGWKKIKYTVEKTLEDVDGYQIIKARGKDEPVFSVKIREIGYDEALMIGKVLEDFRESCEEYDEETVYEIIDGYCFRTGMALAKDEKEFICSRVKREIVGYSVLDDIIDKNCLEEIAVLDSKPIYVYHKARGWLETDIQIDNAGKIIDLINKMSRGIGRRVTLQRPKLNADIKMGRIHAAIAPISSGPTLTIRKFNKEPFTPYDLINNKTVSSEALAFLWLAVQCDFNILIEETPEIMLPHRHLVKLVVNEDLKIRFEELVTDTLRMRPDRIIVGEVRSSEEAKALMNTMLAGQGKGSFSTFHAQSGREAIVRLETMGVSAIDVGAIDIIVVQRRWTRYSGKPEDVRRVIEIGAMQNGGLVKLFDYDQKRDRLVKKNLHKADVFRKICFNFNFSDRQLDGEIGRRRRLLERKQESFQGFFEQANEAMA